MQKMDETPYYLNNLIPVAFIDEHINLKPNDVADLYLVGYSHYHILIKDQWFYEQILIETCSWWHKSWLYSYKGLNDHQHTTIRIRGYACTQKTL